MDLAEWTTQFVLNGKNREEKLVRLDFLVKHLKENICQDGEFEVCHRIDQVVQHINENMLQFVSPADFKFESMILSLPWTFYLFDETEKAKEANQLNHKFFCKFLTDYMHTFPNKADKLLGSFMFIFRGNNLIATQQPTTKELQFFNQIQHSIGQLKANIKKSELLIKNGFVKRFPFLHNASVHEYYCYVYNFVFVTQQFNLATAGDMFDTLFTKILELDLPSFFEKYAAQRKDVRGGVFDCDMDDATFDGDGESRKKVEILELIFDIIFNYIDSIFQNDFTTGDSSTSNRRFLDIAMTLFVQKYSHSNSSHLQYIALYLCSKSKQFCDGLILNLWKGITSATVSFLNKEAYFNLLCSLLMTANFVDIATKFSFLKTLLRYLNDFLDVNCKQQQQPQPTDVGTMSETEVMHNILAIGFARLFLAFQPEFEPVHVDLLKTLDMRRVFFNTVHNPLKYFEQDLREQFIRVCTYYQIGYSAMSDSVPNNLVYLNSSHGKMSSRFGPIFLESVRTRAAPLMSNLIRANSSNQLWTRSPSKSAAAKMYQLATSPSTTSDDAMISSPNFGSIPNNNLIMNHMLSEAEY